MHNVLIANWKSQSDKISQILSFSLENGWKRITITFPLKNSLTIFILVCEAHFVRIPCFEPVQGLIRWASKYNAIELRLVYTSNGAARMTTPCKDIQGSECSVNQPLKRKIGNFPRSFVHCTRHVIKRIIWICCRFIFCLCCFFSVDLMTVFRWLRFVISGFIGTCHKWLIYLLNEKYVNSGFHTSCFDGRFHLVVLLLTSTRAESTEI